MVYLGLVARLGRPNPFATGGKNVLKEKKT
jgi:hypothetical protein